MIMRILIMLSLITLAGGFVFFAANVLWLGTKEFFKIYGPKAKPRKSISSNKENTNK